MDISALGMPAIEITASFVLLCVFLLFVVFSAFVGFVRGMNKSVIRLITFAIATVLTFFASAWATNLIADKFLIEGQTLGELILDQLSSEEMLVSFLESSPLLREAILAAPAFATETAPFTLTTTANVTTAKPGSTVTVSVLVDGTIPVKSFGFDFVGSFDTDVFEWGRGKWETALTKPQQGNTVVTTIDAGLQKVAAQALEDMLKDNKNSSYFGSAGAIVVLDCNTGAVLACVSLPTYDITKYFEDGY